jgi:hypothetical protein
MYGIALTVSFVFEVHKRKDAELKWNAYSTTCIALYRAHVNVIHVTLI